MGHETPGELRQDVVLGLGFLLLAGASLKRLLASAGQSGSETVITTFYSLILFTSVVRAVWFLIPTEFMAPSYAPSTEYAFKGHWVGTYCSEILLFVGSLSLFSIFILMAIFWADLLKGIFKDSLRPSHPMASFATVAAGLAAAEGVNSCLFFARVYSSQGMLMFESALLCMLSLVCSVEISRLSHRFRTVLRTLGAVNQISTDGQITRIVRITVTGNVFFAVRGLLELMVGISLYAHYKRYHIFDVAFDSRLWDWYIVVKHTSEWMILFLMLWILHDPGDASDASSDKRAMTPISPTTFVAMLALLLSPASAFVAPTGLAGLRHQPGSSSSSSRFASSTNADARSSLRPSRTPFASVGLSMASEIAEEKAAKLRETAARFREQAAELEAAREVERRAGADRSFNTFDSNKDGAVDIAELKAGLEGPLRRSYVKQLTARMGRKPDKDEIEARIAQLPGGSLFPDELARKLISTYDENGDGILQKSEFVPSDELRTMVESMFREQRDQERLARMEERQQQMEDKLKSQAVAASGGEGGMNDGAPTAADKALSALPYVLPLADSLAYAGHVFAAFPEQMAWAQPLAGALLALRSLPFATLVAFFGLSTLSSLPQVNKLVRFNMQQAINLDIALILPGVLGALTSASLGQDAYKLVPFTQAGSDVVFVAMLVAVAYSVGASAGGVFPNKLPLLGRMNRENPDREQED